MTYTYAKNCRNRTVYVSITASQMWDVFFATQCIWYEAVDVVLKAALQVPESWLFLLTCLGEELYTKYTKYRPIKWRNIIVKNSISTHVSKLSTRLSSPHESRQKHRQTNLIIPPINVINSWSIISSTSSISITCNCHVFVWLWITQIRQAEHTPYRSQQHYTLRPIPKHIRIQTPGIRFSRICSKY